MLMRLTWPITDPQVRYLDLIDEALANYREVVAQAGHEPAGLPHDWTIETSRLRPRRKEGTYLVCYVEVIPAAEVAA